MSKVRITENKLRQIVSESINKVLNEDKLWMERTIEAIKGDLENITNNIENMKNINFTNFKPNDFYILSSGCKDFNNVLKYIGRRQDSNRKNF